MSETVSARSRSCGPSGRSILLWSAGSLVFLAAAVAGGSLVARVHRVRSQVRPVVRSWHAFQCTCFTDPPEWWGRGRYVQQLGGPEKALPLLRLYVRLPDWLAEHRASAVVLLATCGPGAVPELCELLRHERLYYAAANGLALVASDDPAIVEALVEVLDDERAEVRCAALGAMSLLKRERIEPVLPRIEEAAGDPDPWVRCKAVITLVCRDRGRVTRDHVDALAALLDHNSPELRLDAVRSLRLLGVQAGPAMPALKRAMADPDPTVRSIAGSTWGEIRHSVLKNEPPPRLSETETEWCGWYWGTPLGRH
jgi:HEAT repeat protein